MLTTTLKQVRAVLRHSIRGHYRPPEYEQRWGRPTRSPLYPLLSGYRKASDRRLVRRHVHATDTFLLGHPKSGNTWAAYMLGILINADADGRITLANVGEYVPVIHGKDYEVARYAHLMAPRVFRTEWPVHPELYPKVIYLIRDPRAVLVSYYHMYRTVTGDNGMSLHDFVREYLTHGCVMRLEPSIRWDIQVKHWTDQARRKDGRILVMRYEDMLRNRLETVQRFAQYLRLTAGDDLLRHVVERGAFDSMKQQEQAHGAEAYLKVARPATSFVRRGKADAWKDEMGSRTVRLVEAELGAVMSLAGYEPRRG